MCVSVDFLIHEENIRNQSAMKVFRFYLSLSLSFAIFTLNFYNKNHTHTQGWDLNTEIVVAILMPYFKEHRAYFPRV